MRRPLSLPLILAVLILALAACGGDEEPSTPTATPATPVTETPVPTATPVPTPVLAATAGEAALLRVMNASDVPRLSVTLDGARIARAFRPGAYHSAPERVRAGEYRLQAWVADKESAPPLLEQPVTLEVGVSYVLVLAGHSDDLRLITVRDDVTPLPRSSTRLRVIHALPDAGALDVQEAQRTVISGLDFGSQSDPLMLPEGEHPLTLLAPDGSPLAEVPFDGMARYSHTLVLYPDPATGAPVAVALRSRVEDVAQVRVMHASPDLPTVEVLLDNTLLSTNLSYGTASAWTTQRAATYQLQVRPAGQPDAEPFVRKQITLQADQAITLVVLNTADRLRITAVSEDLSPTPVNAAWLVFVNAAVGANQLSVSTFGGALPDVRPIAFGTASRPLPYAAGTSGFVFETGTAAALREVGRLLERSWDAGMAYTVIVTGTPQTPVVVLATEVGTGDTILSEQGVVSLEGAVPPLSGWGPGANVFAMRVVHALPDNTPIDFLADGALIFPTVQAGTATAYHEFTAPPRHLAVHVAGSALVLVEEETTLPVIPEGTFLTVFVYRDGGSVRLSFASDKPLQIPADHTLVRVFNAVPGRSALRVERLADSPATESGHTPTPGLAPDAEPSAGQAVAAILADAVLFGQASDPVLTSAGAAQVHVMERVSLDPAGDSSLKFPPRTTCDLLLLPGDGPQGVRMVLIAHQR